MLLTGKLGDVQLQEAINQCHWHSFPMSVASSSSLVCSSTRPPGLEHYVDVETVEVTLPSNLAAREQCDSALGVQAPVGSLAGTDRRADVT